MISDPRTLASWSGPALAVLLGSVAWLQWAAGPAPQLLYPSDVVAYLDACQRASLGQWLGRDFSSPIGPAALLPTTLAMKWGGATVNALVIGSMLTWLTYGALAWLAVRRRMGAPLAAAFTIFVAATAAAPYTLDFGSWQVQSYGMLYNRLAWAALALALVTAWLPRTDGRESRLLPAGLGACAVWLWAIKPNYLLILAPIVLYSWPASGRGPWFARAALGAAGMGVALWISVHFSPTGYITTHLGMARAARAVGGAFYEPSRTLGENLPLVLVLSAVWAALLRTAVPPGVRGRLGLALAGLVACTFVANLTNNQFSEIPVWGAMGWLAAAWIARTAPTQRIARMAGLAGLCVGLGFTWQPLAGIAYSFAWNRYRAPGTPPANAVASPAWRGMPMRFVPGDPAGPGERLESPGNYAAWLNDGLGLLERCRPSKGAVLCLDWANPFPFATQSTPVAGDEIAWHVGRTVGPSHHPDIARLLAAATVVMEPRRSVQPASLAFKRSVFASALADGFVLAGETPHWRVWTRRTAAETPPPSHG